MMGTYSKIVSKYYQWGNNNHTMVEATEIILYFSPILIFDVTLEESLNLQYNPMISSDAQVHLWIH